MSSEARGNQLRDTPGRLLLGWALLSSALVLFAWRIHVHRPDYDWLEYPTALGDTRYYPALPNGQGLGENDFFGAHLIFRLQDQELRLYRRLHHPTARRDVAMRKVALEASGRYFVYTDDTGSASRRRFYLKAGEDRYVEFGERLFYPTFEQTRQAQEG